MSPWHWSIYDSRNYWGLTDDKINELTGLSTIVEITEVLQTIWQGGQGPNIYDSRNYWGLTDNVLGNVQAPSTIVEITEVLQTVRNLCELLASTIVEITEVLQTPVHRRIRRDLR